jgi:hypothetical protein
MPDMRSISTERPRLIARSANVLVLNASAAHSNLRPLAWFVFRQAGAIALKHPRVVPSFTYRLVRGWRKRTVLPMFRLPNNLCRYAAP